MSGINDIVFSTDTIKATEKQKEFIYNLIDNLDFDNLLYEKYEHFYDDADNLSKYDAMKLIQELKDITDDYTTNSFWDSLSDYSIWDYGDN